MREIYKNPMLYYLVAPVLVAIWPLLVWAVYLPAAQRHAEDEKDQCIEGQGHILDILTYDPERTKIVVDNQEVSGEFSYPKAIERVATMCGIGSARYNYSTNSLLTDRDKRTQNANVTLTGVGIVQVASFLTQIQSSVNLKCDRIKLTKKQGAPDQWNAEMNFWYTY